MSYLRDIVDVEGLHFNCGNWLLLGCRGNDGRHVPEKILPDGHDAHLLQHHSVRATARHRWEKAESSMKDDEMDPSSQV